MKYAKRFYEPRRDSEDTRHSSTVFVPIEVSYLDNQLGRAAFAADQGLALSLRLSDMKLFPDVLRQMTDPEVRDRLAAACRSERRPNGAAEAAALIAGLVG